MARENYPVNMALPGKVVRLMDKGVVVDIGNYIEGFVPLSQLDPGRQERRSPDRRRPMESEYDMGANIPIDMSAIPDDE